MGRFRHQLVACVATVTISILLGSCCGISKPASLEASINSFYRAEQANDWETMWSLCSSTFKQLGTKEEFVKEYQEESEQFRIVSWKILRVEDMGDPLSDFGPKVTRAVKIPMDVTTYDKATKITKKATDLTDYWIQEDGRWLWHWRGFPTD